MRHMWCLVHCYLWALLSVSLASGKGQEKGVYYIPCGNDKDFPRGNKTTHWASEIGCARLCMQSSSCASFTTGMTGQEHGPCELNDATSYGDCARLVPRPNFVHRESVSHKT